MFKVGSDRVTNFTMTDHMEALSHYEDRIQNHIDELSQKLSDSAGESVNMPPIFMSWSFDVMGDISFSQQYGLLQSGDKNHPLLQVVEKGFLPLAIVKIIPWMASLATCIPGAKKDWAQFVGWSQEQLYKRMQVCLMLKLKRSAEHAS